MTPDEINATLDKLRRMEEEVRRLQDQVIDSATADRAATLAALKEAVLEGLGEGEGPEAAAALVPVAEILGELEGPDVCDLLIDALNSDEPEARFVAGRALQDLAFDRFREVAEATERAAGRLKGPSHALRELPFVIAEVGEPGIPKILRSFLSHTDVEVVASAIEALASLGDPAATPELLKLMKDPRTVQIDDEQEGQITIGILAQEAVGMIQGQPVGANAPPPSSASQKGGPRSSRDRRR